MKSKITASALCLFSMTHLFAAMPEKTPEVESATDNDFAALTQKYEDAISQLADGLETRSSSSETQMNPRLIRLFGETTLYGSSVSNTLKSEKSEELYQASEGEGYLELADNSQLAHQQEVENAIDNAVLHASMMHPEKFKYTEKNFKEDVKSVESVEEQQLISNIVPEIVPQQSQDNQTAVGVEMKVKKPNFWITSGEVYLQFTQNYISGNWSQGGESTNTLMSGLTLKANYNDKQKIQWDNTFEANLGFTTAPSDKEHDYRTNADMIRLTTKLLLKAIKSWNYSFQVESKTQSLRNYPANSNDYTSAFLAPLDTKVGIGMDYKKSWKNFNISVNIAPLTYRWLYVSEKFLAGRYGVKGDHRSLQEFGSSTNINSSWQIAKNIRWSSHIDAFTSYEKVYANWENTFDFVVSKYLSTKLFMHGRFDDGVRKKKGYTYFQFKEFLQFGLSYKW